VGAATIGSIAGCSSSTSESGEGESTTNTADGTSESPENTLSAQASFFVFGEFADAVAGDAAAAETLVPVGQHGHGWEPGPDIQGQILESDLFIYGTDGFQPWADDLITSLRDDNADVEMIATGEGVELIEGGHDHGSDNEGEDEHGHEEEGHDGPAPWEWAGLYDLDSGAYEYTFEEGPDPEMSLAVVPTDEADGQVVLRVEGSDPVVFPTHESGDHEIEYVEDTSRELYESDHESHTVIEDGGTITPTAESLSVLEFSDSGETVFTLDIESEGHYVLFSQHVPAEFNATLTDDSGTTVEPELSETAGGHDDHGHEAEAHSDHEGEDHADHEAEAHSDHEGEDHADHEGEDGHGHDHGAMDPHFWMDPQRASQAVTTLETTFAEMDGDNAETYADNAAAYREQLNELDESIQSTVDDAPKDTLFIAGHDAFQYLEDRYGLRVESLTGLSPDDQPTPRDIERAQGIIDEYGLDYVCADPLESQTAAEQLVAETDATEVLPLTAIPGQTQAWADEDWGYIDVMENVNLDTLETALNA